MSGTWMLNRLHELSVFKEGDEGPLLAARNDGRDVVDAGWDRERRDTFLALLHPTA